MRAGLSSSGLHSILSCVDFCPLRQGYARQASALKAVVIVLAVAAGAKVAQAQRVELTPSRAQPWRLHESILREAYATLDRGRDFLEARQADNGLWRLSDGFETCGPALAFAGEDQASVTLSRAADGTAVSMESALTGILEPRDIVELARGVVVLRLAGLREDLVTRAMRRLALVPLDRFGAEEAAAILEARNLTGGTMAELGWGSVVARTLAVREPAPATVALAGFARLERGNLPATGNAVRAHLRWLAGKTLTTADDAWWLVRFLDRLPPVALHGAGFPLDWRQQVADTLIARQRRDPATGHGFWDPLTGSWDMADDAVLQETVRAVMALRYLAD